VKASIRNLNSCYRVECSTLRVSNSNFEFEFRIRRYEFLKNKQVNEKSYEFEFRFRNSKVGN
jgi:hypothetical protein